MQQQFTGTDMLHLDIANCFGMDKDNWSDRLMWAEFNQDKFEALEDQADEPLLYRKGVMALRDAQQGKPIGHNVFMDATASGLI